jgi:hypothetical protein
LPPVPPYVVDTGGKFATSVNVTSGKFSAGVNDAGGKLTPVLMTPAANNGNNIRLQTPESELEGKNLYICFLYYPKVTKQNFFWLKAPVANLELRISLRIFEKNW